MVLIIFCWGLSTIRNSFCGFCWSCMLIYTKKAPCNTVKIHRNLEWRFLFSFVQNLLCPSCLLHKLSWLWFVDSPYLVVSFTICFSCGWNGYSTSHHDSPSIAIKVALFANLTRMVLFLLHTMTSKVKPAFLKKHFLWEKVIRFWIFFKILNNHCIKSILVS